MLTLLAFICGDAIYAHVKGAYSGNLEIVVALLEAAAAASETDHALTLLVNRVRDPAPRPSSSSSSSSSLLCNLTIGLATVMSVRGRERSRGCLLSPLTLFGFSRLLIQCFSLDHAATALCCCMLSGCSPCGCSHGW